ncbi:AP endonuclease [Pluteus cervinus]|uniref:AP endonuclease n=1 Tax=Pluteus cervinus TaxID=181527 RepID=A0ACD3AHN0_9AGAR|nr:AP endonuclease [Pluteus cervinus]
MSKTRKASRLAAATQDADAAETSEVQRPTKRRRLQADDRVLVPPLALNATDTINVIPETETTEPPENSSIEQPHRKRNLLTPSCPPMTLEERTSSPWKVGAHVSAAGGVENAVTNAAMIGANAFALFLKSQRKWESKPLTQKNIEVFKERMERFGYDPKHVLPHGSYLVNLGNADEMMRNKSYTCFLDELRRCEQLGLKYFNFHPGSTLGKATPEQSIAFIAQCINRAHTETESVVVVIENMAGSGNVIGSTFDEIAQIIDLVEDKTRVGVCLDTCHMFAAGYDVRTNETWKYVVSLNVLLVKEFEETIGLKYLCGMHLNDSKNTFGSKKDRHENVGIGHIGMTGFLQILTDPRVQDIPLILETPSFEEPTTVWRKEIEVLNKLSSLSLEKGGLTSVTEWLEEKGGLTAVSESSKEEERHLTTASLENTTSSERPTNSAIENAMKRLTQDVKGAVELGKAYERQKKGKGNKGGKLEVGSENQDRDGEEDLEGGEGEGTSSTPKRKGKGKAVGQLKKGRKG